MSDQTTAQWLRAATNRIATGSTRICLICARQAAMKTAAKGRSAATAVKGWLGESEGIAWLVKVGMLVVGGLILRKLLLGLLGGLATLAHSDSWRWLLWPAAMGWIIAAYRIGHPDWTPPTDSEKAEQPETPEEPAQPETEDPPAEEPESGATVTFLKEPPLPSHEDLTALSVPVEPVRMKGRGSSTGVRADRFPAPSPASEDPLEDVVAAGQEANNNDNNVRVQHYAGGAHITVTPAQRGA